MNNPINPYLAVLQDLSETYSLAELRKLAEKNIFIKYYKPKRVIHAAYGDVISIHSDEYLEANLVYQDTLDPNIFHIRKNRYGDNRGLIYRNELQSLIERAERL